MDAERGRRPRRPDPAPPPASAAAVALFAYFSRFEFALKEAGYLFAGRSSRAQPDWQRFARLPAVAAVFGRLKRDEQVLLLIETPPREQILQGGMMDWRDPPPVADAEALVEAVKRVRNNLFHGGKSGADPRDDALCAAATLALSALLEADDSVRAAFLGHY